MSTPANGTRPRKPKAGKTVSRVATPKALSIPKPKRERYLELRRQGMKGYEAARTVDAAYTGRLFRSLAVNDDAFAAALAEVEEDAAEQYREWVAKQRRRLVEDGDGRMTHYESMFVDPDYRAVFQKTEVAVTGANGGPVEVHTVVEPSPEEVARILKRLEQLGLVRPGPVFAALAEGKPVLAPLAE